MIIIVEDLLAHQINLRLLFKPLDTQLQIVPDVIAAKKLIFSVLDIHQPEQWTVILIDQRLPGAEGWILSTHLRQSILEGLIHPAHVIGMSAYNDEESSAIALEAGCTALWEKPLTAWHQAEVQRLLRQQPPLPQAVQQQESTLFACLVRKVMDLSTHVVPPRFSADDIRLILGLLLPNIHLQRHELAAAERLMSSLGGQQVVFNQIKALIPQLNRPATDILAMMVDGYTNAVISKRLGMSRREWYQELETLFHQLAQAMNH